MIINYFYRHNCLCEHCQSAFKRYLRQRFSAAELRDKFAIGDLDSHRFREIVSWHSAAETTPLRLEMLRFSQISNKAVFDDVFVRFGRSLKPDLIVAQWNHLGNMSQLDGDERCLLPGELWGRDESYLWYSTGGAANYTDLKNHILGEATLQARYVRGAFDDRPFTLGKYEGTRIRAAIAELAANGGAPMGFYTTFTSRQAHREIVRYYQFLKRFDEIYRANRPHAEVALVFPRARVHQGKIAAVESFRKLGHALLDAHVLFDVWPDDQFPPAQAARSRRSSRLQIRPIWLSAVCRHSSAVSIAPTRFEFRPAGRSETTTSSTSTLSTTTASSFRADQTANRISVPASRTRNRVQFEQQSRTSSCPREKRCVPWNSSLPR